MSISSVVFPAKFTFDFCEPETALVFLAPLLKNGVKLIKFEPASETGNQPECTFEFPSLPAFREFARAYIAPAYMGYDPNSPDVDEDVEEMVAEFVAENQPKSPTINVNGSPGMALVQDWAEVARAADVVLELLKRASPHGRDYPQGADALRMAQAQFSHHARAVKDAHDYAEKMALAVDAQL